MNSHILMALGFAAAAMATISIGRYGHATIFLIAIVEAFVGFRYPFHSVVRDYLLSGDPDPSAKIAVQVKLLAGAGAAGAIALLLISPFVARMSGGQQLMTLGTLIIMAMLGIELISLHHIDAVIYHPIASFALCAIIYFVGGIIAAGGALMEGRRRRKLSVSA